MHDDERLLREALLRGEDANDAAKRLKIQPARLAYLQQQIKPRPQRPVQPVSPNTSVVVPAKPEPTTPEAKRKDLVLEPEEATDDASIQRQKREGMDS